MKRNGLFNYKNWSHNWSYSTFWNRRRVIKLLSYGELSSIARGIISYHFFASIQARAFSLKPTTGVLYCNQWRFFSVQSVNHARWSGRASKSSDWNSQSSHWLLAPVPICGTSMRTRPPLLHTCRELKQKTSFALIKSKYRSAAAPPFVRTEFTKNERLGVEHSHNEPKTEARWKKTLTGVCGAHLLNWNLLKANISAVGDH